MKVPLLIAVAAISTAIAPNAAADESQSNQKSTKAVPHENYWDANQWDPFAGSGFWHEKQDRRAPAQRRSAKKQISPLLMPPAGPEATQR